MTLSAQAKLLLIDVYSLVYRAFFALPALTTSAGLPINAAYGFERMLSRVLRDEKPTHVIACFDAGIPAERLLAVPEYKAQRPDTPDTLRPQFSIVRRILEAYTIPAVEVAGEEADDCIATIATRASAECFQSVIVSGDLDLLQLVDDHCTVVVTRRGISEMARYDIAAVHGRYGLLPSQLPDYRGLKGDPSDNLPGVPGIGEKTATSLIAKYGSLDALLDHVDDLPQARIAALLKQYGDQARRARDVSRAKRSLAIDIHWDACSFETPSRERLAALYAQLEFRSLLTKISAQPPGDAPDGLSSLKSVDAPEAAESSPLQKSPLAKALEAEAAAWVFSAEPKYRVLRDSASVIRALEQARNIGVLAIASLPAISSWRDAQPLAFALAWEAGSGVVVPSSLFIQAGATRDAFGRALLDETIAKIFHDAKNQIGWLRSNSLRVSEPVSDTMIALGLLDPAANALSLEDAAAAVDCGMQVMLPDGAPSKIQLFDPGRPLEPEIASSADALFRIAQKLKPAVKNAGLDDLLREIEWPLAAVLAGMEPIGFRLDIEELSRIGAELDRLIVQAQAAIYAIAGEEFNLNSPKALGAILFDKLQLPGAVKTKTGFGTGVDVLSPLASEHEIAARILEYREVAKLKSTYVDALPTFVDKSTGRLHTTLRQLGSETGRLSSSNPNLQNIPIRSEAGRAIRRAFLPATRGNSLLSADYSQIELRLFAHLSQDPTMIAAFVSGEDIHSYAARAVFGLPADEPVPKEARRRAKAVNFGILYGMGTFGLAQSVGFSRAEAKQFINQYFERFPRVREYIEGVLAGARAHGYVTTLFGRRRYLPDLSSRNHVARAAAERMATNAPLQGSAADLIKLAMVRMARRLEERRLKAQLVLQVHDELIFDVLPDDVAALRAEAKAVMEGVVQLHVPLVVDFKVGPNWAAAEAMN